VVHLGPVGEVGRHEAGLPPAAVIVPVTAEPRAGFRPCTHNLGATPAELLGRCPADA
jgi:hypothetical protein